MRDASTPARSRAWRLLALLLAFGLVAAACGGDDSDDEGGDGDGGGEAIASTTLAADVEEVSTGGTLIIGLEAETNGWLPGTASIANAGTNVARAIYDSIAARGADGNIYPNLAESIEANEELTEWTVTLREGLEFHDGTPLDAEAIKSNFDNVLTLPTSNLLGQLEDVTELRIDGPLTYTYVLSEPNVAFPDLLVGSVGYPFSPTACPGDGQACMENPVGAGPFVFESWTRDSELRVVRNDNYWRTDANGVQLPYLDELVFRPIPDEDARFQSALSGDIHVGQTLRQSIVSQAMQAADEGTIQSFNAIGNDGGGSIFNTLRPPVDDQRVRLGLAHAVDQADLVEVLGGTGITPPQTQYFSPDSPWYSAAVEEAWPKYDPDRATELLDEYINDPERSDGKAPGEPIAVDFNCPPDPSLILISQAYEAFWNAVGVQVTLNQVEQAEHIQNALGLSSDPPLSGDYMINCWRMGGNEDPYTTLSGAFGPWETEASNFTNYTSPTVDEQIEILGTTTEFEDRYAAVETIMLEFTEQVPNLWTGGTATSMFALNEVRNLGGWTIPGDIQGDGTIGATVYWAEVWLEQ